MNKEERRFLFESMKRVPNRGVVVEIGSWTGKSSIKLARGIKEYCQKTRLFCVDFFDHDYYTRTPGLKEAAAGRDICEVFKKAMKKYPHTLIMETSEAASHLFEPSSVDFIFIDADHSYEAVKKDIEAWLPKVKADGVLCGHDYYPYKYGVKRAVDEVFGGDVVFPARSIWVARRAQ